MFLQSAAQPKTFSFSFLYSFHQKSSITLSKRNHATSITCFVPSIFFDRRPGKALQNNNENGTKNVGWGTHTSRLMSQGKIFVFDSIAFLCVWKYKECVRAALR
jgi:hypothetical protein